MTMIIRSDAFDQGNGVFPADVPGMYW